MKFITLPLIAALGMVGCGGGGSSGGEAQPAVTFNADAAFTTLLTTPVSFTGLSARDAQGNNYALDFSMTPAVNASLNGTSYKRTIQNIALRVNGVVPAGELFPTQFLFTQNPTKLSAVIAETRNSGFSPIICSVSLLTSTGSLPSAGSVGSSGPYATAVAYPFTSDCSSTAGAVPTGNQAIAWSIETDTATTAFACLNLPSEKDCLKINAAGSILGARITVLAAGQTLVFQ